MKDWHCYINNQTYGPYPENLLMELINRGQLTSDTYVYNNSAEEAQKGWQRAIDTEIAALFLNNSQGTQTLPPIQNQGTTRVSPEALEGNAENRQFADEGDAKTFSSNNAYEPGRRHFEKETKHEKLSVASIIVNKFKNSKYSSIRQAENQAKMANKIIDFGLWQAIGLIILSIAIYFLLKQYLLFDESRSNIVMRSAAKAANTVVEFIIIKPYRAVIIDSIFNALKSCAIPSLVYIFYLMIVNKFQSFEKTSHWIAYIAMPLLVFVLCYCYKNTNIIKWIPIFINISSMAVILGLWFHSRKFASVVVIIALSILNVVFNLSISLTKNILSWIPVVSGISEISSSTVRLVLNVIEIAQVCMLLAIAIIVKKCVDYFFYKRYGLVVK
jgi:hypothetical protein